MKRVLIFTTAYFPHVGGAEIAIKEITDRLGGFYEFDLICARYERTRATTERIGNVQIYRVGWGVRIFDKLISPFWGAILALRLDSKRHYGAYWAMMVTYTSGAAYVANILRFWRRTPVILTLQEGDPPSYIRRKWFGLVGFSWSLALSQSSFLTVISSYLAELARTYGYKKEIELIPNGVDVKHFSQEFSKEQVGAIREKLEKKEGDVFLITTSRLVKKNACDDVIKALSHLPENVHFVILGTGPDEDMLRALTKKLGVESRVRFVGFVDHQEMPNYLKACDIFIRPSLSEGFGSSFVEAFAAGIPVIATQEGGIADFLFDPVRNPEKPPTGRAVDVRSPEQIARAVKLYMEEKETTELIVKNAKALAISKYDWDTIAGTMRERIFDVALID